MPYHRLGGWWRGCAWLALAVLCASHVSAASIFTAGSGRLSGWVYIDRNNDGELAFANEALPECVLVGAEVALYQLTTGGDILLGIDQTDGQGHYSFSGLGAGSYALRQIQPEGYLDGLDTLGELNSLAGGADPGFVAADAFEEIVLASGTLGTGYNFGERGLLPGYVSKRYLLGTTPLPPVAEQQVPEPTTSLYAVLATAGAWLWRRRRQCASC